MRPGYPVDSAPHRHQITELPLVKATVTEHQVHSLTCPCCGTTNRGTLPPEVAASQFGPNLVGLMALLMGCYRLSKRQVVDVLANCFGIELAASSVVNQQRVVSQALAQSVEALQGYVQQQDACNVDETSWRQADQAKRCWLWVVVTTLVTVFHIASSRSGQVAGSCWGMHTTGWSERTAAALTIGSTPASGKSAGAIWCAISRKSWSAAERPTRLVTT